MTAGDGETACGLMTARGQQFLGRVARNLGLISDPADCAAAVAAVAESAESAFDPVDPADVSFGPTQLPGARAGRNAEPGPPSRARYAQVNCRFRGGYGLKRIGQDWRVFVPLCFD